MRNYAHTAVEFSAQTILPVQLLMQMVYNLCAEIVKRDYGQRKQQEPKIENTTGFKVCSKCGKLLPLSSFPKSGTAYDGYYPQCRDCHGEYYKTHKEQIVIREKEFRERNRDRINSEAVKKYRATPSMRISTSISSGIRDSLVKGIKNERHWETLVNFTLQDLLKHLESQFTPEMTWDNYGEYWEIDHIIPQCTLPFDTIEDTNFKICWSLANLRPLEMSKNRQRPRNGSDVTDAMRQKIMESIK